MGRPPPEAAEAAELCTKVHMISGTCIDNRNINQDSGGPAHDNRDRSRADRAARRSAPVAAYVVATAVRTRQANKMTLAGLEPAIFGSEDQRLIH